MNSKILTFILLIVVISCSRSPKEIPLTKLNGINGEAFYIFNNKGEAAVVIKEEYNNKDVSVSLERDTILPGSNFVGRFSVIKNKYRIIITSPTEQTIESDSTSNGLEKYTFSPGKGGVYNFNGVIEYDSTQKLFEYKFIVIQK